ncbi:DUF4874 domain-containing protein [Streptomyces formicae]|uniref:DUF4874 domain-containing protein n=1 Tax=Streptomyces formicae TaxID=1616117 RepID=A0A291Q4B6_9ACTN|nr:DUF4874 domain-containing protein [Streptomyces formicae]ATL26345.1 hypothetical protein KY5_1327 [Streptomyces formicae]
MERRRLLTTALGTAAVAAVPLGPAAAARAASTASAATRTAGPWTTVRHRGIRPDDPEGRAPLANPRRGFRYEMSYNALDLTSPWPNEQDHSPDVTRTLDLLEREYGTGANLTQLYFYLWDFATSEIPQSALDNIERVLRGLRSKGYAAVLRFVYDDGVRENRRYTVRDIQRHIGQLAPLVARHSDVVAVWQAGFLGTWGEWHGSHYGHETYPDAVTAIMTTLVEALPPGMHTQVRYAEKRDMITNRAILDRVGFHNDYVTLGEGLWDYYVPDNPGWPRYLQVSQAGMMDGEMPWDKGQSADPYAWSTVIPGIAAARRLQTLRFDSLSLVHNATVTLPGWKAAELTERQVTEAQLPLSDGYFRGRAGRPVARTQFEYLRDHLGYRLEVREARHDVSALRRSGRLPVEVDVVNRGFAAPKHPRPVRLVLLDAAGRTVASADTGADWRAWQPQGRSETGDDHAAPAVTTVRGELDVPKGARGPHRIGLALPDPAFPGRGRAVRCANASVAWVDGVNVLTQVRLGGR